MMPVPADISVWQDECMSFYDRIVSPYYEHCHSHLAEPSENAIVKIYESCDTKDMTDVLQEVYNHNYSVIVDGLKKEVEYNPEFKYLRDIKDSNPRHFEETIAHNASMITDAIDSYDMYQYIVDVLAKNKLSVEMLNYEDPYGEYCTEDFFGDNSVCIVNDCQNILMRHFIFTAIPFVEMFSSFDMRVLRPRIVSREMLERIKLLA